MNLFYFVVFAGLLWKIGDELEDIKDHLRRSHRD